MRSILVNLIALSALFIGRSNANSCWKNMTCTGPEEEAFPGDWSTGIYAPNSRTVSPASTFKLNDRDHKSDYGTVKLFGNGSTTVYDFGKEVGGLVTLEFTSAGNASGAVGLAFTEALNWIGQWSDSSNGRFQGPDGALYADFSGPGTHAYTMPDPKLRGGFRYLTCFLITSGNVTVDMNSVELNIAFQPTWPNLRAYQGYFHSSDGELNKIWYSGAYTLQTNAVPVDTGRWVPMVSNGWANNGTLGPGNSIIVDGAKRDRAVWPGDMGVAVPSTYVSIGDLDSVKNALQVMYNYQNADGSLPEAGPPLLQQSSDSMCSCLWIHEIKQSTDRNRSLPYVDLDWHVQLRALYRRHRFPKAKLEQLHQSHRVRLWEGSAAAWPAQRDWSQRLG